jgi:hypothetical protein
VVLDIETSGPKPMSYRWLLDEAPLSDEPGRVEGATSSTLTLREVTAADEGLYRCEVTNLAGTVVSSVARLAVRVELWVVSAAGAPEPAAGVHYHMRGTEVSLSMPEAELVEGSGETRQVCTGWTGTGSAPESGAAATLSFALDEPTTVSWQWRRDYRLRIGVAPVDGGRVVMGENEDPAPAESWQEANARLSLTAQAGAGRAFWCWERDLEGKVNPVEIVMGQACSITARFVPTTASAGWQLYD